MYIRIKYIETKCRNNKLNVFILPVFEVLKLQYEVWPYKQCHYYNIQIRGRDWLVLLLLLYKPKLKLLEHLFGTYHRP